MSPYRPTNQERGLEENVRRPVVPSQSAANIKRMKLDGSDLTQGTDPLRKHDLSNLYEGPEGNVRRPVESTQVAAIDTRINQVRADMRAIISAVGKYQRLQLEPPKELIDELKIAVKKLYSHTLRRIHYMHRFTQKAFKFVFQQQIAIRYTELLPTGVTAPMADDVTAKLVKKQKQKLVWQMERLQRTNHPVWQKDALASLANLEYVGIDVSKDKAKVMSYLQEYEVAKVLSRYPGSYELGDGAIMLSESRGTADRGTE